MNIIYLHVFNSSAESKKSKILDSYLRKEKLINLEYKKLNKISNWNPKISLEDGLKTTVNWYLKNKIWYSKFTN